jgi:RING-like zinc finger
MNPNSQKEDEQQPIECCICINSMAPFQALFLAPCSHTFHYKCVTTLLGTGYMFQCPLCRQVANLEASVAEPDTVSEIGLDEEDEELMDNAVVQDTDSVRGDERVDVTDDDARMDMDDDSAGEVEEPLTSPVDIPIRSTNRDTVISPSTPQNTIQIPTGLERASNGNQPRRPDVPVQIFNTLTKLADALSKGDGNQVENSIDEYGSQMKTLLLGLGGNEANAKALLAKMVETMQNSSL